MRLCPLAFWAAAQFGICTRKVETADAPSPVGSKANGRKDTFAEESSVESLENLVKSLTALPWSRSLWWWWARFGWASGLVDIFGGMRKFSALKTSPITTDCVANGLRAMCCISTAWRLRALRRSETALTFQTSTQTDRKRKKQEKKTEKTTKRSMWSWSCRK